MKKASILLLGTAMVFTISCQQKKLAPSQSNSEVIKTEVKAAPNKIIFDNLDIILSPFEDMTEFALNKNEKGILESLNKIENANKNSIFEKNLSVGSINLLNSKIAQLQALIKQKNYNQIALASTEIFEFNISNFADGKKIEKQIQIEHLDYMGFKILALLNQDKIDWAAIEQTIDNAQKNWLALNPKVSDGNLKDTFNYLFKGLLLGAEKRDVKMCGILANMNLSLVDVMEKSI
ncbi:MAG: hypothetical protein WAV86_06250 [Lutibacter sp.]